MKLVLIRHGQTSSNVDQLLDTAYPGADLDEVGRRQAEALVERLADHEVELIVTSQLPRTQQTIAPFAAARGVPTMVHEGLREISAGEDEMSPHWQRYVETLHGWASDPTLKIPGGEDAHEFIGRFDGAIEEIAALGHRSVVVVSHGAALRTWAGHRVPGFFDRLGRHGLPNTTVVTIEGSPQTGWALLSLDVPPGAI